MSLVLKRPWLYVGDPEYEMHMNRDHSDLLAELQQKLPYSDIEIPVTEDGHIDVKPGEACWGRDLANRYVVILPSAIILQRYSNCSILYHKIDKFFLPIKTTDVLYYRVFR
jgi:hypothetical protein